MGSDIAHGRVALVTGASRGIGRAIAKALAANGAAVAVNYRANAEAARQTAAEIEGHGGRAITIQADVADKTAVEAMAGQVTKELGPIDILVNNAGLLIPGELLDYKEEDLDRMWGVNVKGVLHCTGAVVPSMIERKYGRIINLSSNAAMGTAFPGTTMYAATKAAVAILTKRFAFDFGKHGITVNAVLPGFTVTDMTTGGKPPEQVEQILETVSSRSMLARPGEVEDIAHVVSFLASDKTSFMTGQYLMADGGRMDYLTHTCGRPVAAQRRRVPNARNAY